MKKIIISAILIITIAVAAIGATANERKAKVKKYSPAVTAAAHKTSGANRLSPDAQKAKDLVSAAAQAMGGERFNLSTPDKNMDKAAVQGWISLEATTALFKAAGFEFDALKAKLLAGKRTSLRQAIQELRPATSAAIEAQRAEYDAIGTITLTQQQTVAPPAGDTGKVKPAAKTPTAPKTPKAAQ